MISGGFKLTSRELRCAALAFFAATLLVLLGACGSGGGGSAESGNEYTQPSELASLAEAAADEGTVSIYGPPGEVRPALVDAFEEAYPDITVEFWSPGKSSDLVARVSSEVEANRLGADLIIWGSTTHYGSMKPLGIYESIPDKLVLEDVENEDLWVTGGLDYADIEEEYLLSLQYDLGNVLAVNTNEPMVEELESYQDLLAPEWRGKVLVGDPEKEGQALYAMSTLYNEYGEDFFAGLAANEPELAADIPQLAEQVARGVHPVGISAGHTLLVPYIEQGVPVEGLALEELTYISAGYWTAGLMKEASHPNAAQLYLNWLLTVDAQDAIARAALKAPIRTDVPLPEGVLPVDTSLDLYEPGKEKNAEVNGKTIEAFNKYFK